jgi:protocatechuate 3,4-dioxygenase beta subunit
MPISRRTLLSSFLAAPALPVIGLAASAAQTAPALTPACNDGDALTIAQTEGPFFTPDTPLKHDLAADSPAGERITVAGYVVDERCQPIPKALIEIWHADENGAYDNRDYKLRGHQFSDDAGRWWFTTIVPAAYPGRTRHYHFKVQKPGGRVLTTQLYFPGEPLNRRDRIFDDRLLMSVSEAADGKFGRFDFVL